MSSRPLAAMAVVVVVAPEAVAAVAAVVAAAAVALEGATAVAEVMVVRAEATVARRVSVTAVVAEAMAAEGRWWQRRWRFAYVAGSRTVGRHLAAVAKRLAVRAIVLRPGPLLSLAYSVAQSSAHDMARRALGRGTRPRFVARFVRGENPENYTRQKPLIAEKSLNKLIIYIYISNKYCA